MKTAAEKKEYEAEKITTGGQDKEAAADDDCNDYEDDDEDEETEEDEVAEQDPGLSPIIKTGRFKNVYSSKIYFL